jgi:hypothetical protein
MLHELQKIQPGISGGFNKTHPSPASRLVNAQIAAARCPLPANHRHSPFQASAVYR